MNLRLPPEVGVVEVGPRDGLQSFPRWVPTEVKVAIITRLVDAGCRVIEATAFGRPDVIPNLRDAEEVMALVPRRPGVVYRALVPNVRGARRAARAQVTEMSGLVTVSETYTRKNQNMSVDSAIEQARLAFEVAEAEGIAFSAYVGMAMFCPYEGRIAPERTLGVVEKLASGGIRRFILAGSLGLEDPRHVYEVIGATRDRWGEAEVGFHIHNLAGFATANALAALAAGASTLEGSIAGIGGGVAVPGAMGPVGNIPTEDLVHLLNETGIETGLDTGEVAAAARDVASLLGIEPGGYVTRSGTRADVLRVGGTGA